MLFSDETYRLTLCEEGHQKECRSGLSLILFFNQRIESFYEDIIIRSDGGIAASGALLYKKKYGRYGRYGLDGQSECSGRDNTRPSTVN